MAKRIAANVEDLYSITMVDSEMIKCRPKVIRRNYVATILRTLAEAVEAGNIVSIDSIQWNGYGAMSGSLEFDEVGVEPFEYDLS